MDLQEYSIEVPDTLSLLSDEARALLAQYWDDNESDLVNQQLILRWLRSPHIPDRVQ